MFKQLLVIHFVCYMCYMNHGYAQRIGDFCTVNSGEIGQCELIEDCPSATNGLLNGVMPKNCGFQNSVPIVCCISENITPSSLTTTTYYTIKTNYSNPPGIGRKARAKCLEYRHYVFNYISQELLILPAKKQIQIDGCGINANGLIISGNKALPKEFPHMALLGYNHGKEKLWKCSGSLISEYYILTAGHCLYLENYGYVTYARLGALDATNIDDAKIQEYEIEKDGIIKHPRYTTKSKYDDIGLLNLKRRVEINFYVRPACLHTDNVVKIPKAIATGWINQNHDEVPNTHMIKEILNMYTNLKCNKVYSSNFQLIDGIVANQICAGSLNNTNEYPCNSGGPLQIYNNDVYCMYKLVGVSSFSKACGTADVPTVFTRITKYVEWIENIVWP